MQGRRAIEHRHRVLGLLCLLLALLVVASLVTYSANDYPHSSRGPDEVLNGEGRVGAMLASLLFIAVGYWAYGIPALLLLWGWNRLRSRDGLLLVSDGLTVIITMIAGATATSLIPVVPADERFQLGGVVGLRLAQLAEEALGTMFALPVSTTVALVLLLVGVFCHRRRISQRTTPRSLINQFDQDEIASSLPASPSPAAASRPFSSQ